QVVRRPLIWGGAATVALLALAAPALGMRTGSPAIDLPSRLPVVQTLGQIQRDFPGRPAPAQVVVTGVDVSGPGIRAAVTGNTASGYDFGAALRSRTPLVFALVAGLALVLLMVAFRSLAIPLISIGLNLLSVGAAYGLVTLIFQDGRLQGLLGFTSFGAIIPWVPLFMFVFLFGLSMDYHVFILSRIRELRARGKPHREAVVGGIASCSGVVTSAAVIMVAVFSIFATLSIIELKMIGV